MHTLLEPSSLSSPSRPCSSATDPRAAPCCTARLHRHLPLARDLVRVARQRLVFRLDSYCKRHNKLFLDVIK
jgi:hypothetical protein